MKISVALCTYNGEHFLPEQLESIARQSRVPDEIVVCDDGSTDRTAEIVLASSLPIRWYRNESRLGSTKNFEKAISLCTGDIIALSDQDDIWYPWRLSDTQAAFRDSSIGLAFGDGVILGSNETLWRNNKFTSWQKRMVKRGRAYEALLNHNFVTGATMAFRSNLRRFVLPISELWVHDGWIALIAAQFSEVAMIPRPVIKYRRHSSQQVGVIDHSLITELSRARAVKRETYLKEAERFRALPSNPLRDLKIKHLQKRAQGFSFLEIVRYFRFSDGFKSIAKDLLLADHSPI